MQRGDEPILATITGEFFQPVRLHYRVAISPMLRRIFRQPLPTGVLCHVLWDGPVKDGLPVANQSLLPYINFDVPNRSTGNKL